MGRLVGEGCWGTEKGLRREGGDFKGTSLPFQGGCCVTLSWPGFTGPFFFFFFFKILFVYFQRGEGKGERGGEKHQCVRET